MVFMLDRNKRERSGVQKLRQASLVEERGEDDGGLAGTQHSQCSHSRRCCRINVGTRDVQQSCSHGTQLVKVVLQPLK